MIAKKAILTVAESAVIAKTEIITVEAAVVAKTVIETVAAAMVAKQHCDFRTASPSRCEENVRCWLGAGLGQQLARNG